MESTESRPNPSNSQSFAPIDTRAINAIRALSIDAIEKANSGHPGLPLGAAPMAYVLWKNHLKHNPKNPEWFDRDRFVLSAGHGSMLLYSMLHLFGYPLGMNEIQAFRQWGSLTPGHPEFDLTPGVEATTGPLGQGSANAIGMAIAERRLAAMFNKEGSEIVDHHTYALVSDGDLMEGISAEAASLAGHLKLGKLIYLYDDNDITLDGPTSMTFSTEDVAKRYESYGWHVSRIAAGDTDFAGIDVAIKAAKAETSKPSLIIVKTTIGYGSPLSGTADVHGKPLKGDQIDQTRKTLGIESNERFSIPSEVRQHFQWCADRGKEAEKSWKDTFSEYQSKYPELAKEFERVTAGELPARWETHTGNFAAGESIPTRKASGQVLNKLAHAVPELIGGDADLSCSTNTALKDMGSFDGQTGEGRNLHYGVREHAMAAIANGVAYHGGLRNYVATFFCFSDYMKPSLRLAAMNKLPINYVWTHDSIGLGEDGPTHQPIEHLMALRAIPNFLVIRPCDATETADAWKMALGQKSTPAGIVLTRQNLTNLNRDELRPSGSLEKGAYILKESSLDSIDCILIGTGSEVHLALQTQEALEKKGLGARVVSMPCWELFEQQTSEYREKVLPSRIRKRVSIEAGSTLGWHKWVGSNGLTIGLDRFGASAPAETNFKKLGLDPGLIAEKILKHAFE